MPLEISAARPAARALLALAVLTAPLCPTPPLQAPPLSQLQVPAPTTEEIEARVAQLDGLEPVEGSPEAAARQLYLDALGALRDAARNREQQQRFEAERDEAGALIEALRAELAQAPESADPVSDSGLELEQLDARAAQAEADLTEARDQLALIERALEQRTARIAELPAAVAAAQQQLQATREALIAAPTGGEREPRRVLLRAQVEAGLSRVAALEAERATYEASRELLPLRRDRAERRVAQAERVSAFWSQRAGQRREQEGDAAAQVASRDLASTVERFPLLEPIAAHNRELTGARTGEEGLPRRIAQAREALEASRQLAGEVDQRFGAASRRIQAGGLTEGMAILLRRDYEWLPAEAIMRNVADKRDRLLADAQLQWIALDEERADLADPVRAVDAFFEGLVEEGTLTELPPADAPVRAAAFELFGKQREAASSLFGDLGTLIALYAEQVSAAGALSTSVEAYRGYIERHILWVPSSPVVGLSTLLRAPADFGRVIASLTPTQVAGDLKAALAARPGRSFLIGVVLFALIAGRRFLRRKLEDMGQRVRSFRTDAFIYTVRAVVQSFLIALPLPLIAWSLGWALSSATHEIERAIGSALRDVGVLWLGIRFLWRLLVDKGVGAAHFKWPTESLRAIRRELRWFEPVSVILSLVVLTLDRQSVSEWSDSVGRLCFLGWMGARALLFHRVLRPGGPLTAFLEDGRGLFKRTHLIWSRVVVALPLVLGLLAALGYFYTALQFELRLRHSMGFALSLVVIHGLLLRWLFVNRRRLAVAQALEAKARREREQQEVEVTEAGAQAAAAMGFEADQVDIPDIDARTRELFRSGLTLASVLGFYLIWTSALPALQGLDRVQLLPRPRIVAAETEVPGLAAAQVGAPAPGPDGAAGASAQAEAGVAAGSGAPAPGGSASQLVAPADAEDADPITGGLPSSLTLADLLLAILLLLLTNVATRNLPALLELTVLQQLPLDSGSRYAVTTIIRYAILMVGISAVSRALGIGWAQVQWLAAALTFGLAFGLQEIFANFVSGLIILIERPVRVGDIVTVGGTEGRITQLRMRATTILDWDRREFLIPNKEFITGTVTNWTLSDPITRMVIPVGIAYGSDTNKARKLLLEVARANPLVTKDPAPSAIFRGFGDSTLDFSLRVFLPNRDLWPEAIDGLHAAIDDAFRKADIEIAFPQRDLHIRSAPNFVIERNEPSDRASDRSGSQPKTPEEPRS